MKFRFWPILLVIWTPLALAAGWWLWHMDPGPQVIVRADTQQAADAWWKLFHRNFHPAYPWLLLAPYVFFLCARFPLGIRRPALVVPALLLACAAFTAACIPFAARISRNTPSFVYVDAQPESSLHRSEVTNRILKVVLENLSQPEGAISEVRQLENSVVAISRQLGENDPSIDDSMPLTVVTEFQIDLRNPPPSPGKTPSPDDLTQRSVILSFENELLPDPAPQAAADPAPATPVDPSSRASRLRLLSASGLHVAGFLLLAVLAHAGVYFRHFREREQRSTRLHQELTEARLSNLQHQLQPHFLFNSLNGISSHIHDQPDRAVDMIALLGDLLRRSLDHGTDENLIPLREELTSLDHYLELQSMRFGDRLHVSRKIAPDTLDARVPSFLLQPLAENVIRHAVEATTGSRHLAITCRLENQRLKLSLSDDGPGPDTPSANPGTGTGLRNIRERLNTLFPADHQFAIEPSPDGAGTIVNIDLPASPSP